MSFIQFENAREKEMARADLREAREQMLEQAKKRAELRVQRDTVKQLKGEGNWMLPSLEKKLKIKESVAKKPKTKKDKKKKSKSKKKRRHQSSSDEDSSECTDDSTSSESSSSSEEESRKHKKSKKSKKNHKRKSKNKNMDKCKNSDSETDADSGGKWIEKKKNEAPLQRDSWMTESLMLKTYTRERTDSQPKEKQQIDAYDPAKSCRELNPYWRSTGTGLPSFQKPREEDNDVGNSFRSAMCSHNSSVSKGWKKQKNQETVKESNHPPRKRSVTPTSQSSSSEESETNGKETNPASSSTSEFLTDQQMNELGAKIVKAEIMGNMDLAEELRKKLDSARIQRDIYKERKKSKIGNKVKPASNIKEDHILLTRTDQSGQSRPLPASKTLDPRDMYGGKKKQKRVKTHDNDGQRVRYFADDDRCDIKKMFESEKCTTASDANVQFANIAAKNKNPNDDLEDIFADQICKNNLSRDERKERDRAVREHQKMEAALDNCDKCFDSTKMQKELLVSVGEKVYLALPWYKGIQPGHCIIVSTQHCTCCTQLDEDTWSEVNDFRKALTRMFAAQRKDVIFFEIANRLHKRPHLAIHCIPIKESEGEMAPFYFKKAIEESEHEWSVNKQLVSLRNKSLRSCIPKGLPYFWVNFGMETGFAHVIEDEERFPPNFAQEIIGGMLNLDVNKWRRLQKEQNIITQVKVFADWWKKYDCTK